MTPTVMNGSTEYHHLAPINERAPDVVGFIQGIQEYLQIENTLQSQHLNVCIAQNKHIDVLANEKETVDSNIKTSIDEIYNIKQCICDAKRVKSRLETYLTLAENFLLQELNKVQCHNQSGDSDIRIPLIDIYTQIFEDDTSKTATIHFNALVSKNKVDGKTMVIILGELKRIGIKINNYEELLVDQESQLQIYTSEADAVNSARVDFSNKVKICSLKTINIILRPSGTPQLISADKRTYLLNHPEVQKWIASADLLSILNRIREIYRPGNTPQQKTRDTD